MKYSLLFIIFCMSLTCANGAEKDSIILGRSSYEDSLRLSIGLWVTTALELKNGVKEDTYTFGWSIKRERWELRVYEQGSLEVPFLFQYNPKENTLDGVSVNIEDCFLFMKVSMSGVLKRIRMTRYNLLGNLNTKQ